ncbi:GPI transamidase component GAA1, putative [Trypanosoma cruzi]|uniref:GPI transamidase component GAA1, putative n=2 Tax=Trypanosoma cruzi TaxID=5693 RepID=Q4D1H2_TRYCC|nr:GPI transamidase component GAA1, putative [Trypanosoma cruzi]EAN86381.1 GPI transamidase component GAA1, putative [Trypanosoma cruzi]|eukprot:XP_808232.1 GPI transamidase component GAA1 [Trypanosoma cruzi strain CL Brener]
MSIAFCFLFFVVLDLLFYLSKLFFWMFRERVASVVKKHASNIAPFLLLAGVLLIVAIPAVKPRKNFIDESAVNVDGIPVLITSSDASHHDATIHQYHRIVHGHRSVGSESIAVYVNTVENSSIILANFLIRSLQKKNNMACETHFYFVNGSTLHWPIPNSFVRAALFINVSSLKTRNLCFSVYGKNGMQPNQDLFNVAVAMAREWNLNVDILCQNPHIPYSVTRSKYEHYLAALQTAVIAPQNPQPWYFFRSNGISMLAIGTEKSDGLYEVSVAHHIAAMHEQLIGTLSYLDERFHHSTSVWVPLSVTEYVEYDIAQFGIILLVASLLSVGYSIYELEGLSLSPRVVLIFLAPVLASGANKFFGVWGSFVCSIFLTIAWSVCAWELSWLTINAVMLCLLIILQPATGLLVGSGVAVQLFFLHVKCQKPPFLFLGTFFAWAVLYYFIVMLKIRHDDMNTIGGIYLSFFVYPNALWVTSRLIRSVLPTM